MKKLLLAGEKGVIEIIKLVYEQDENKNFYKPNLLKPEIAILNTNFTITLYNYKEFIVILFERCIILLQNMLYLCKNEFISNYIVKNHFKYNI